MSRSSPLPLVLCLCLAGCFPYYGQPADDSGGSSLRLGSSHAGWQNPACWSCHTEDSHNAGLDPFECTSCHGTNGARGGHTTMSPCNACHHEPHGSVGFPDPESCLTCHPVSGNGKEL